MKLYATNLAEMVFRYYAMMAVIIIAGFSGQWWLSIVAFVLFFAALTGAKIRDEESQKDGKMIQISGADHTRKAM